MTRLPLQLVFFLADNLRFIAAALGLTFLVVGFTQVYAPLGPIVLGGAMFGVAVAGSLAARRGAR